jgi:hypothetical protein
MTESLRRRTVLLAPASQFAAEFYGTNLVFGEAFSSYIFQVWMNLLLE